MNEDTGDKVDYDDLVKGAEVDEDEYVMLTPEELESVEPGRSRTIEIRPKDRMLVLETMYFADEVRDPCKELENLPQRAAARGKDLNMAIDLIKAMTSTWDPKNYRDTYTERVEKLIEAKKKKDRPVVTGHDPAEASEKVVDLLAALQASLDQSKKHRSGNTHDLKPLETRKREADDVNLDDHNKAQLGELAKDLDIAGRSKMTARQLRNAVEKARHGRPQSDRKNKASYNRIGSCPCNRADHVAG